MHSALLIPSAKWTSCAKVWLGWREALNRKHHVPATFELHGVELLHGDFEPLPPVINKDGAEIDAPVNRSEGVQREVYEKTLRVIGQFPGAKVITCYQPGTDRMASYQQLLDVLQEFLVLEDEHALLCVDGTDSGHSSRHKSLDEKHKRVIEEPWMQDSKANQFVQAADLVAHAAFQCASRQAGKSHLWEWYETWLSDILVYAPGCRAGIYGL